MADLNQYLYFEDCVWHFWRLLLKLNHIAGNNLVNLDKTNCIVLIRLRITSYHISPNFKNLSEMYQFTREGTKNSSRAGLKCFTGRIKVLHGPD